MRAAALRVSGFIAKTNYFVQKLIEHTGTLSRMLYLVIGASSVERRHKHIDLSRREFKLARELDRMRGIDDARKALNALLSSLNSPRLGRLLSIFLRPDTMTCARVTIP